MDLSIIIVNYNTKDFLVNCVKSIFKHVKGVSFEIIVVDNGSKDDDLSLDNVELIKNKKNLGFAGGNNLGLRKAKGDYVLLLNPDTLIEGSFMKELLEWMESDQKIGIASCSLLNPDGSIQSTGGYFPNLLRVFTWMTIGGLPVVSRLIKPFHPKGKKFYSRTRELDWVTGAFFLMKRKVMITVGLLDDDYFMYTEEVDYCYRAKKCGWKVAYNPNWGIIHYGGMGSGSEFAILSEFEGIKLFYKKHFPAWQRPFLRFFLKLGALARIVAFAILGETDRSKIYVKAFRKA